MKKFGSILLTLVAMLGLCAASVVNLSAADLKPVVTVSFAGYDELMANLDTIGKLGNNPDFPKSLETLLSSKTQGKTLDGVDKKAPWGVAILTDGEAIFTGYGFIPVKDFKQLIEFVKSTPIGQAIQESDGIYEIPSPNGENMYVMQRGNFAAIARDKAALESFPADPTSLLGDLPKKYVVAVCADVKNIPEPMRDQAVGLVAMFSQMGLQRSPNESDDAFEFRSKMTRRTVEQVTMLIKETEQVLVGLNVDRKTNKTNLDLQITAKAGSKLAEELTRAKPGKTNFAGFDLPGSAVVMNVISTMTDKDVTEAKEMLQGYKTMLLEKVAEEDLSESQMKLVQELATDLVALIEKNLDAKKSDMGMSVRLDPSAVTFLAGGSTVDGKAVEALIKKVVDALKAEEPKAVEYVKLNAETYKGIRFSTIVMPTPEEEMKPFIGDTLDIVVAVGDSEVYVAAGRDAVKTLKQAIDQSKEQAGKDVPASRVTVSLLQIAKFLAAVAPDDEKGKFQIAVGVLEQTSGKDRMTITSESVENGMKVRVEVEEGLLKILGMFAAIPVM